MTIDAQFLINFAGGSIVAIGGWFARQLWDAVQKLKEDVHQIEVDLPKNYVVKDDLDKRMKHIEDMFQRIYDKLDEMKDSIDKLSSIMLGDDKLNEMGIKKKLDVLWEERIKYSWLRVIVTSVVTAVLITVISKLTGIV